MSKSNENTGPGRAPNRDALEWFVPIHDAKAEHGKRNTQNVRKSEPADRKFDGSVTTVDEANDNSVNADAREDDTRDSRPQFEDPI